MSTEQLTEYKKTGMKWQCPHCTSPSKLRAVTLEDVFTLVNEVKMTVADVKSTCDSLKCEQQQMQSQLNDVIESQKFINDKFGEMETKLQVVDAAVKDLQKFKQDTQSVIVDLKTRLVHVEQYSRRMNLEFHKVKSSQNEDLVQITILIAEKLGVQLTEDDVDVAHRIPSRAKKAVPSYIVRFSNRKKRDALLNARYNVEVLNKDIFQNNDETRIFISESLSPYFKNLLWCAKKKAQEKQYDYCWFRNSKICVKKSEDDDNIINVLSEDDLSKIV